MQTPPFAQSTLTLASVSALGAIAQAQPQGTPTTCQQETAPEQSGVGVADSCFEQDASEAMISVSSKGSAEWVALGRLEARQARLNKWLDTMHFDKVSPTRQARELALMFLHMPYSQRLEVLRLVACASLGEMPKNVRHAPLQDAPLSVLAEASGDEEYLFELQGIASSLKDHSLRECLSAISARLVLHTMASMQHAPDARNLQH